jgi:NDP-sugar pyrophosphorylase family protein
MKDSIILSIQKFIINRSISKDTYVADPVKSIAKKSRINKCIVGTNFSVGDNTKVNFSYLFDNITIEKE